MNNLHKIQRRYSDELLANLYKISISQFNNITLNTKFINLRPYRKYDTSPISYGTAKAPWFWEDRVEWWIKAGRPEPKWDKINII